MTPEEVEWEPGEWNTGAVGGKKPSHLPCQSFQRLLTQPFTFVQHCDTGWVCGSVSASLFSLEEMLPGINGVLGVPAGVCRVRVMSVCPPLPP